MKMRILKRPVHVSRLLDVSLYAAWLVCSKGHSSRRLSTLTQQKRAKKMKRLLKLDVLELRFLFWGQVIFKATAGF